MAPFSPRKHSVGKSCQRFEARMVGEGEKFSETEGPENLKRQSQLGSKQIFLIGLTGEYQPGNNPGKR
jgi:hypothetical protein